MKTLQLGHMIALLRQQQHLSQKTLAEKLNVSTSAIGLWETNKRLPPLDMFTKLADYFSVSADLLLQKDRTVQPENFITDINNIVIKENLSPEPSEEQAELLKETFLKLNNNDKYILMGKAMELLKEETKGITQSTAQGKRA
ncbi:MAG: helix-turn-helix transcriptional regulator [Lachnospiraceae bacterium]|nr:helix-turn-helix transcriptional regulator [Lachnospiraceae bacterium]